MEANYQTLGLKLKKKILTSFDIKNDDILNDSANIQKALFSSEVSSTTSLFNYSVTFPSKLIFKSMTSEGTFLKNWKKSNLVLIHKRESKILSRLPVGLLLMFSKFFERLVSNTLFNFFFKNKLFTTCKFDFIPGDSCVS